MDWWVKRNAIKVTHVPTGTEAYVDCERSQHQNKIKAMGLLKARIWALMNLVRPGKADKPVASYILPGDITHPDDITEYKKEKQK